MQHSCSHINIIMELANIMQATVCPCLWLGRIFELKTLSPLWCLMLCMSVEVRTICCLVFSAFLMGVHIRFLSQIRACIEPLNVQPRTSSTYSWLAHGSGRRLPLAEVSLLKQRPPSLVVSALAPLDELLWSHPEGTLRLSPVPCQSKFDAQSPFCLTSVRVINFLGCGAVGSGSLWLGTVTNPWVQAPVCNLGTMYSLIDVKVPLQP